MKIITLTFLFLLLLQFKGFSQQETIHLYFTDNSALSFLLDEVQKLDFDNDQLRLHQTDGTVLSWDISTINYYSYNNEVTSIASTTENKLSMSVFPNPSSTHVNINYNLLANKDAVMTIITLEGKVLERFKLNQVSKDSKQIDVSAYPTGQYLVRIDGAKFSLSKRFIKN